LISLIAVFLSVAFLGQIFSVFTAIELRYKIRTDRIPSADTDRNMKMYLEDESVRANWDWMQRDLRCCGGMNYETGFQEWGIVMGEDVPDSCCHVEEPGCGEGKIARWNNHKIGTNMNIWKDGCLEILSVRMRNDLVPMLMVYAGVGVLMAIVELITIVLACAYVAQIGRRVRRDKHIRNAMGQEEEYLPSLNAKETNF